MILTVDHRTTPSFELLLADPNSGSALDRLWCQHHHGSRVRSAREPGAREAGKGSAAGWSRPGRHEHTGLVGSVLTSEMVASRFPPNVYGVLVEKPACTWIR